jgi:hypothetical protein
MRARAIAALAALLLAGCATVKPWEKAELSKPHMRFSGEGAHAGFIGHALLTNEQAEGGDGGAGGGCGCR